MILCQLKIAVNEFLPGRNDTAVPQLVSSEIGKSLPAYFLAGSFSFFCDLDL